MSPTTTDPFAEAFPPLFGISLESVDVPALAPVFVLLVFIAWAAFTAVAAYHWFRYAHRSWMAVPAIAVHVAVSGMIALYALSGLR